jgi:hypothetical protein
MMRTLELESGLGRFNMRLFDACLDNSGIFTLRASRSGRICCVAQGSRYQRVQLHPARLASAAASSRDYAGSGGYVKMPISPFRLRRTFGSPQGGFRGAQGGSLSKPLEGRAGTDPRLQAEESETRSRRGRASPGPGRVLRRDSPEPEKRKPTQHLRLRGPHPCRNGNLDSRILRVPLHPARLASAAASTREHAGSGGYVKMPEKEGADVRL